MAGFASDSGSEYSYGWTASDEEFLFAAADHLSAVSPHSRSAANTLATPATPATPAPRRNTTRGTILSSPFSPELDPDATLAIEETLAAISDDDLSFDLSELQEDDSPRPAQGPAPNHYRASRSSTPEGQNRRLAPSVPSDDRCLASFVSKTKPRSMPTLLPGPDVRYPDLSHALSDVRESAGLTEEPTEGPKDALEDNRSPLLRFRTIPMKPLSVTDLTAGSWCELQYFYTLTKLPGGRKTRTAAMKRGTKVHEKLEQEIFKPVKVDISKREDSFGLRIWNMIQGLRVLREQGFTREFEVWGMVEGNMVCGIIDGLSYENPDEELQEDVLSSRGSSQTMTNSQPYEPSTPDDYQIYITDVKTRNSDTPPPQSQVRVSIIQLFLYHRFLSDMAAGRLDYTRVLERYGLDPEEPFSDSFMAQIGAIHDDVFAESDADTTTDADGDSFVSAPSSPSQLSHPDDTLGASANLRYRTLHALLTLFKSELRLTFPRGAADLGTIVQVEYRYRGRDPPPQPAPTTGPPDANCDVTTTTTTTTTITTTTTTTTETAPSRSRSNGNRSKQDPAPGSKPEREPGSVISTHTFFVESETLDLFLSETMRWWTGDRAPRGVPLHEAAFKCRSCEFRDECEWRRAQDQEALRKAGGARGTRSRAAAAAAAAPASFAAASGDGGDGDVEDGGVRVGGAVRRKGRSKGSKGVEREEEVVVVDGEGEKAVDEVGMKKGRGRPKKLSAAQYW